MLNIDDPKVEQKLALFNLGFRVFFLAAGLFAVISMLFWLMTYSLNTGTGLHGFVSLIWHSHEMVYGYSMAVVSGFLLTAVTNWTGQKTLIGKSLIVVFLFWLLARVFPFVPIQNNIEVMLVFDTLFFTMFIYGISRPVIQTRQWKHISIILVIVSLMITNIIFYMGQLEIILDGVRIGLYAGFYLILTLVLIMARRVVPFFIEKGVDSVFSPKNYIWIDKLMVPVFVIYALLEVIQFEQLIISLLAGVLFVLNLLRLSMWYTHEIWKKPLVWVLLLAYLFITLAFALKLLDYFIPVSDLIVLHAFAVGGVGMVTIGMMARVALGHTGRNVFEPPATVFWMFSFIVLAVIFRVIFPAILELYYLQWIMLSQLFWIVAFSLFTIAYSKMLIMPRVDGRPG